MIKDILEGIIEVVVEIGTDMLETCQTLLNDIDAKLMGSYEEIEAYEKAKKLNK